MTTAQLLAVFSNVGATIVDCNESEGALTVRMPESNGISRHFKIVLNEILAATPTELSEVLTGVRPAAALDVITRVVGYYSRVSNWNRSKLSELKNRQSGLYDLPISNNDSRKTDIGYNIAAD